MSVECTDGLLTENEEDHRKDDKQATHGQVNIHYDTVTHQDDCVYDGGISESDISSQNIQRRPTTTRHRPGSLPEHRKTVTAFEWRDDTTIHSSVYSIATPTIEDISLSQSRSGFKKRKNRNSSTTSSDGNTGDESLEPGAVYTVNS